MGQGGEILGREAGLTPVRIAKNVAEFSQPLLLSLFEIMI
jgi:hypothetical protein